jgi:hypothetical protein
MNTSQKGILVTLLIWTAAALGWGWVIKPQVAYQMQYSSGFYSPYDINGDPIPLPILVHVENRGDTHIVTAITVTALNATISNSQNGPFEQSVTETLLIQAKQQLSRTFYVLPTANPTTFGLYISRFQTLYGIDVLADLLYFIFSSSIYQPVNHTSLAYERDSQYPDRYNPL